MFLRKKSKSDDLWLDQDLQIEWLPPFEHWRGDSRSKTVMSYVEEWIAACAIRPVGIPADDRFGSWDEIDRKIEKADRFGLRLNVDKAVAISGKLIHTLEIDGVGPLTISNCAIKNLELRQDRRRNVRLENCKIGSFRLSASCVATLEIVGCSVRTMSAPAPSQASPFTGSVEVRRSNFSPAFENAQAYRNLRHHLGTLHNHEAASIFHAAEMEAEAGRQSVVDRAISFCYRWLSNYGGSSARPLIIFAILVLANFLLLYGTDGVTLLAEPKEADGWHFALYGLDETARLLRAAVFAISQVFNPLGIFGTRLLLSAETPTIALASALLGLASTIAFALFVLAVRRRFRLDRNT
jgi:hypothetical protein